MTFWLQIIAMRKVCVVVASMPPGELYIPEGSFVIAADKGYLHLHERGIQPDVTVGDFDSLGYVPNVQNLIRHPMQKDDTDMLLAVRVGLERGATHFVLYGGLGGRLDHTLANVQTLAFIRAHGAKGILLGDETAVYLLQNDSISFSPDYHGIFSAFCFGEQALGVTETGLLYRVENATLTNSFPLGVSNEFIGRESTVQVQSGSLLLCFQSGAKMACDTFLG